jgi:hypothetical protein
MPATAATIGSSTGTAPCSVCALHLTPRETATDAAGLYSILPIIYPFEIVNRRTRRILVRCRGPRSRSRAGHVVPLTQRKMALVGHDWLRGRLRERLEIWHLKIRHPDRPRLPTPFHGLERLPDLGIDCHSGICNSVHASHHV